MSVAGFGFRAGASVESLADALSRARAAASLRTQDAGGAGSAGIADGADGTERVTLVAAPADKADAPCLRALAERLSLNIASVSPEALAAATVSTRSARVFALRATGSVAEAAALVAAGEGAVLLGPRVVSADRLATCALARRVST